MTIPNMLQQILTHVDGMCLGEVLTARGVQQDGHGQPLAPRSYYYYEEHRITHGEVKITAVWRVGDARPAKTKAA